MDKIVKVIKGNVTSPKGFNGTAKHTGVKKVNKDLSIITSDVPCVVAGTFTKNVVKAAPVLWDMKIVNSKTKVWGVVTNSGNANACTGEKGIEDNELMAKTLADLLTADKKVNTTVTAEEILVCSTGVIGVNLPIDIITKGIASTYEGLGSSYKDGVTCAEGIMTTDLFAKMSAVSIEISGKTVTIGGMAKGSGMIHPNMATMLSYITTDCNISQELLDKAIKEVVNTTYNMISVDGDTSTNDTLLALSNGLAENEEITTENEDYNLFKSALFEVNKALAIAIVTDGEGATKLMEATVINANTKEDAVKAAKSVVSSSLFKAALFGEDANWGRVLCAMGYSGADFDPFDVSITFLSDKGYINLMEHGKPIVFDEDLAKSVLSEKKIVIQMDLHTGKETATAWGCDLSYDYVKINGDYRS